MINATIPSVPLDIVLERNSPIPMYVQIAGAIEAQIAGGSLRAGDCIESEHSMRTRLEISRITVRLATDELVKKGLLERRQGKGTYVAQRPMRHNATTLNNLLDTLFAHSHAPSSRLLTFGPARPPRDIQTGFGTLPGEKLIQLDRLYLQDDRPVGIGQGWMLPEARSLNRAQAEKHSTARLLGFLGLRLGKTEMLIRAAAAGRGVAAHLQLSQRAPVLVLSRRRFLADGRVADMMRLAMNPAHYEFFTTVLEPVDSALLVRAT